MNKTLLMAGCIALLISGASWGWNQDVKSEQENKIEELMGMLGTRYWEKAADELVQMGEAVVDPLIELLNRGSGRPSENANYVLARIGTPKALDAIVKALKNQKFDGRIRGNAAAVMGDIASEEFIDPLLEALKTDGSWWVRHSAVSSLGKIGTKRVLKPLIDALNDESLYVRRAAVSELGKLEQDVAVLPLIDCLDDEDWQVRLQVTELLAEIGTEIDKPLLVAVEGADKRTKAGAASVLGRRKSENAVFPLISLLEEKDWMVRDEAALALSRINSDQALKPLMALLHHKTGYVREEAAWVLGEMRAKVAVESLIRVLDDDDMGWMAAVSLGKIGGEEAAGHLKKRADDPSARVGQGALWALERMESQKSPTRKK
jgi:HEAT repeat protein